MDTSAAGSEAAGLALGNASRGSREVKAPKPKPQVSESSSCSGVGEDKFQEML